ncbi:MAG: hypothetical protein K0S79_2883 [Nitrospira sp.]|nr:hypothetical protein [Nitrospira sp.]
MKLLYLLVGDSAVSTQFFNELIIGICQHRDDQTEDPAEVRIIHTAALTSTVADALLDSRHKSVRRKPSAQLLRDEASVLGFLFQNIDQPFLVDHDE